MWKRNLLKRVSKTQPPLRRSTSLPPLEEYKERCARGRADILLEDHRRKNYTYCKSDAEILSAFRNTTEVLDQSAWNLLKERVPKYSTFLSV
mmetsp:Transcript_3193/g.5016  ORF Transcript_3193/g.5016 Transcript_3193/m.5016 type:complete len:92 (-) Transcript_3193:761-1036(-)